MKRRVHLQVVAIAFVATVVFSLIGVQSQNTPQATVAIDPDDIGGVVTSSRGPEAGVWVIASSFHYRPARTEFAAPKPQPNSGMCPAPREFRGSLCCPFDGNRCSRPCRRCCGSIRPGFARLWQFH